jgi:hypothetical protein
VVHNRSGKRSGERDVARSDLAKQLVGLPWVKSHYILMGKVLEIRKKGARRFQMYWSLYWSRRKEDCIRKRGEKAGRFHQFPGKSRVRRKKAERNFLNSFKT